MCFPHCALDVCKVFIFRNVSVLIECYARLLGWLHGIFSMFRQNKTKYLRRYYYFEDRSMIFCCCFVSIFLKSQQCQEDVYFIIFFQFFVVIFRIQSHAFFSFYSLMLFVNSSLVWLWRRDDFLNKSGIYEYELFIVLFLSRILNDTVSSRRCFNILSTPFRIMKTQARITSLQYRYVSMFDTSEQRTWNAYSFIFLCVLLW